MGHSNDQHGDEPVSVIQVVVLSTEGFSFLPLHLQPHLQVMPSKEAQQKEDLKVNSITLRMPLSSVCARKRGKGCLVATKAFQLPHMGATFSKDS